MFNVEVRAATGKLVAPLQTGGKDRLQVQVATSRYMIHYFERESSLPPALTGVR